MVPEHLAGHLTGDASKATATGLTARPLDDVVADLVAWDRSRPPDEPLRAGLDRAREVELLRRWRERRVREEAPRPGP